MLLSQTLPDAGGGARRIAEGKEQRALNPHQRTNCRHDFRGANFGVYCIDGAGTSFLDDAFSVDPDTREVFIHITDVQGLVPAGRYAFTGGHLLLFFLSLYGPCEAPCVTDKPGGRRLRAAAVCNLS